MVTPREAFEARLLASRYGPIGRVAGNYRMAGFQVKVIGTDEESPVNFLAWKKGGERFAVKVVVRSGEVKKEEVEALIKEAEKNGARPILFLYGRGPKMPRDLAEEARSKGLAVRRFRA